MMILLKGFFRKRTTIIYSIIISTLLTSVILLFMFIKYYSILNTTYFETNSYIMIVSKYNHGGFLKTNENISNFEKGLIFEPDYTYGVLKKQNLEDVQSDNQVNVFWEDLMIKHPNIGEGIFVFPDDDLGEKEVALVFGTNILNKPDFNTDIATLTINYNNKKIGFYYNTEKIEFIIKNVNKSNFSELRISNIVFQELSKENNIFIYKVTTKSILKANLIIEKLKFIDNDEESIISLNQRYTDNELDSVKLNEIINILSIISYVIIFIFFFVLLIVLGNIVKDEYNNIIINKLMGYNKNQIKKYLTVNIFVLILNSFILSAVTSIILLFIISQISHFKLMIFDLESLIIYGFVLIITILFLLVYKIPNKVN